MKNFSLADVKLLDSYCANAYEKEVEFEKEDGTKYSKTVCFYPWEKTDYTDKIRQAFNL